MIVTPYGHVLYTNFARQSVSAILRNWGGGGGGGSSCLGVPQCLEEAKQADSSVDVPYPPLQIINSVPFCLFHFSLYLYPLSAPFLNPLSSPFPSLSTISSFSSDQFSVPLR